MSPLWEHGLLPFLWPGWALYLFDMGFYGLFQENLDFSEESTLEYVATWSHGSMLVHIRSPLM